MMERLVLYADRCLNDENDDTVQDKTENRSGLKAKDGKFEY